jgi:hypothetical protein
MFQGVLIAIAYCVVLNCGCSTCEGMSEDEWNACGIGGQGLCRGTHKHTVLLWDS